MSTLPDPPLQTSLVTPPTNPKDPLAIWAINPTWNDYLLSLKILTQSAPSVLRTISLSAQSAAIPATPMPLGTTAAGLYRVAWTFRITTAATVSSSLTVTIQYTDGSVSCQQVGAGVTGNATNTVQSGVILLRSDTAAAINYAVSYASVGATSMVYKLDLVTERLS